MTIETPIMLNSTLARTYDYLHHITTEKKMDSILVRQRVVQEFLVGDASHLIPLYEHYCYIADLSWKYTSLKMHVPKSLQHTDLEQQAHFELLNILKCKVLGKDEKFALASINEELGHPPCLGLRPFLITSVRLMMRRFVIEQSRVIKIKKIIYEKDYIKKHGEPNPVTVVSNVAWDGDTTYGLPGATPVSNASPYDLVVAWEALDRLRLTSTEKKIIQLRQDGWTLAEIGDIIGKDKATISRKLQNIQIKWKRYNG